MSLIDTHAHLTDEDTDKRAYLERCISAGVKGVIFCGTGLASSRKSSDFASAFPENFFFAAGVHPLDAASEQDGAEFIYDFASRTNFVAVGEIGLDYYYGITPEDVQKNFFSRQLEIALDLDKPAIIHCRDKMDSSRAYDDAYAVLERFAGKGGRFVLHAFAGTVEQGRRFTELGAMFGAGGMLTFKKSDNVRETLLSLPLDRILLETDAPYLAPVPFRGKQNHPAYLPSTADFFADLVGRTRQELEETVWTNTVGFFGISERIR